MTRTKKVVIGAFLVGGFLLFAGGLFLIGDRRLLFVDQFELNTTFGKVTGLQVGSRVRLAGLEAGEVLEIAIPASPSQQFRVRMRIREDVRQLIRTDSVGAIQTDGLVGSTFIQVALGTEAAPIVTPGATIEGRDPVEFADLIQEGRDTFRTVTTEVLSLKNDVSGTITALTTLVENADGVITDTGQQVAQLTKASSGAVEDFRGVMTDVQGVVEGVRAGRGTIGQLFTDDALYRRINDIGGEVQLTMKNVRETTDHGRVMMDRLAGPDGSAQRVMRTLQDTLTQAQEVVSDLGEGSEALKRNFLFRGFFRDRGFYDLDAITRDAYLGGALENDRTALRVWIEGDLLFGKGPDGIERLTDAGRRRIDAAMGDLVRFPRDSPLVVEGYAEQDQGQGVYLASADRAVIVRDYIIERFRRKATLVDTMAMGSSARASPRGTGAFSGVALALFVRNEALMGVVR